MPYPATAENATPAAQSKSCDQAHSSGAHAVHVHDEPLVGGITTAIRQWINEIGQMPRYEVEFPARLAHCVRPADAALLCSSWMARRVESTVDMQHRLLELWLAAKGTPLAGSAEARPSDKHEAGE